MFSKSFLVNKTLPLPSLEFILQIRQEQKKCLVFRKKFVSFKSCGFLNQSSTFGFKSGFSRVGFNSELTEETGFIISELTKEIVSNPDLKNKSGSKLYSTHQLFITRHYILLIVTIS